MTIKSPPRRFALSVLAALCPLDLYAERYFNPAFLSDDPGSVADLSLLEKGYQRPGSYRVDIWRNDEFIATQDIRFERRANSAAGGASGGLMPCFSAALLERISVNMAAFPAMKLQQDRDCIDIGQAIPGAQTAFTFSTMRLDIGLPQASMHLRARDYIPPESWDEGIPAALFNYSFSGNHGTQSDSYFFALQSGLNYGPWRLRNNGAWRSAGAGSRRWENIASWLQRTVVPLKGELVMGDSNTQNALFDSIGFRGLRLFSADAMYPDSQQGYAPTVRGIARTPARLTIRQNGYVIYQSTVAAGPFTITDLNPTSSSGDLDVVLEEKDGSQQRYSVPYSTLPLLQREGRIKYDVVAGRYRSGNRQYASPFFTQGTIVAGLADGYTLYGGTQLAGDYAAFASGAGVNLGDLGALSLDLTHARSHLANNRKEQGESLRFMYAKSLNQLGTHFQFLAWRYSTRGFHTLDEVAYPASKTAGGEVRPSGEESANKKRRVQANITHSFTDYGSLYLSGMQQTYWDKSSSQRWLQLGYADGWRGVSYALSWSWSYASGDKRAERIAALNISVPFSALGLGSDGGAAQNVYASANFNRSSSGQSSWQTGIGGTLLDGSNLSYNLNQGSSNSRGYNGSANAHWQAAWGRLNLGYNYDKEQRDYNWQFAGGAVAHADGLTFAQPLGDTNVLIKAPGAQGVRIENQPAITTDWRGYAVVPYATVYRHNRVALDTATLSDHTDIESNVGSVVPTQGALVRASFTTRIGVRALLTVMLGDRAVPFGSLVTERDSGVSSMVGEEGQVFLSGLPLRGELLVQWGARDHERCIAPYALPEASLKQPITLASADCVSKG